MGCGCGGSSRRQQAIQNQAAQANGKRVDRTVPATQTPGYFAGPKAPAPKP
jgi:hypothetical protein